MVNYLSIQSPGILQPPSPEIYLFTDERYRAQEVINLSKEDSVFSLILPQNRF